ncbi:hypothetical protein V495_00246 [Pseudogymnoascus sp. VKM F-4514 (FW-929)]|nr:hypothetical protein V495_00246 [Pseudogymnoascus sp. VKM F-4514 (FW-929)]KFY67110.1 hypothetical protein V497_00539 [Pseudogymnoascus sp. VKM F-4516 (FW-969)]
MSASPLVYHRAIRAYSNLFQVNRYSSKKVKAKSENGQRAEIRPAETHKRAEVNFKQPLPSPPVSTRYSIHSVVMAVNIS